MARPSVHTLLRHIAREEPLSATVRAFPGLTREELGHMLESLADTLGGPVEERPSPPKVESSAAMPLAGASPRMRLFSDGAARGNPGPAGAGAVLVDPEGQVVARLGKYLGTQTNNYAEYMGLLLGLRHARSLGVREVEVLADSELLIRQLEGRYQVKSATLKPLHEEAARLLKEFAKVKLAHVPREKNKAADEMSNRAIDERM
ncbi:MAG TPA: ribonuclease HI family protein [Archangium sp.]|nr:ribonuclease HI family protein [Archangium sp.]